MNFDFRTPLMTKKKPNESHCYTKSFAPAELQWALGSAIVLSDKP
jgi:hypothetical protein